MKLSLQQKVVLVVGAVIFSLWGFACSADSSLEAFIPAALGIIVLTAVIVFFVKDVSFGQIKLVLKYLRYFIIIGFAVLIIIFLVSILLELEEKNQIAKSKRTITTDELHRLELQESWEKDLNRIVRDKNIPAPDFNEIYKNKNKN